MFVCLLFVCLFLILSYLILSFLFSFHFFPGRFFRAVAYIPKVTALTIPHFNQVISLYNLSKLYQPPLMQVKQVLGFKSNGP